MPLSHAVQIAIETWRTGQKGRKRLRRPISPKHPKHLQSEYFNDLHKSVLMALRHVLDKIILKKLPTIIAHANAVRPQGGKKTKRADTYGEDISDAVKAGKIQFEGIFSNAEAAKIAARIAKRVNNFNFEDTNKVFKSVLGVDVFRSEPWLRQEMEAFTNHNVDYITSISDQFFDRVKNTIFDGARTGQTAESIAKDLEKDYDITEGKAALIARDQVSKFNGSLTKLRQTEVGVKSFIWQTAEDDRVRTLHQERDGKTFDWDHVFDETADDGPPGQPIQCRCVSLPVFSQSEDESEE